jgi:hypothetical protein
LQPKRQLRFNSRTKTMWPTGVIATKQLRPSAPPAHFAHGRRIESLHSRLYECQFKSIMPADFFRCRFVTFAITPNMGRIHCFAVVGSTQDGWEVESPDEAVKWYNLFTHLLGEPLHFDFMGFGQENEPPNIEDYQ